jgi:outer membrane receptor protein involved in Fe transport
LSTAYNADVSLSVRYLGETEDLNKSNAIDFDSQTYFDVAAVWSPLENYQARIGINNVSDNEPPVTSNAGTAPGNGNTFPAYFDALGRYMFLTLEANF